MPEYEIPKERVLVERELNSLIEKTLRMQCELEFAVRNSEEYE